MESGDPEECNFGEDETNLDLKGLHDRVISHEDRLDFVTRLEIEALLMKRMEMLNDPTSPYNTIHPKIVGCHSADADLLMMLIAELLDDTIVYPIAIVCGDTSLLIHKDLKVHPGIVDIMVGSTATGGVSYDSISDIIKNKIPSATTLVELEIEAIESLRRDMVKNPF
jgi:hypothetical protein